MVVIMLAGVMFPLWPVKLRVGVWYLSILALGLLGALIVLAIVRLIFWCLTVVAAPKAIWIFPNLFEDVGFVSRVKLDPRMQKCVRVVVALRLTRNQFESFVPLWAYDEPKKKKKRVKGASKKGDRSPRSAADEGAEGAEASQGQSTGAQVNPSAGGLSQRQSATVEEIEDDDA